MRVRESKLTLTGTHDDNQFVVRAVGYVDISTAHQLEEYAEPELSAGKRLVIDLSEVDLCDSTGLGVLVRLKRRASDIGAEFVLRAPRRHVADVLAMTGVSKLIPVDRG